MSLTSYFVREMRVVKPSGKTAERNPERRYTVHGIYHTASINADGSVTVGEKLSIRSKNVDAEHIVEGFALDLTNGILTLPEGERGRKAAVSLSQEEIDAELAALRGAANSDPTSEPESTPEPPVKGSK